jgi:uncharacterized secreted protein with C-terminal beta-propeller domain
MKKTLIISALVFSAFAAKAQDACDNKLIRKQIDSLKTVFQKSGFQIIQEASVSMESENELPVMVPMKMGTPYQVVFIGDVQSQSYEVKMYDFREKQVFHSKTNPKEGKTNIISYAYIPQMSEYHLISTSQRNDQRKKELCGYILLLKK